MEGHKWVWEERRSEKEGRNQGAGQEQVHLQWMATASRRVCNSMSLSALTPLDWRRPSPSLLGFMIRLMLE